MSSLQKLGALAVVGLFAAGLAAPADAQRRQKSGSSVSTGSKAAPRAAQGGGQSAGPRTSQGSGGSSAGPRQTPAPGRSSGARPARPPSGSRPATGPATGRAVPRPAYRPGYGPGYRPGYAPGYGYRHPYYGYRYPYYGYRGYYPWYGYGAYYPWYYSGFYFGIGTLGWPYYYGAWPYAGYGYSYDSYDYGYESSAGRASLKVEVKPKSAEVYVDGHFAGIVDQFDGMFDSLPLEAGEHEITIYQEGFRSIRQRLNLSPGSTYRVKGTLEPLAPGEPNEPRPQVAYESTAAGAQVQMAPQYQPSQQYPPSQAPEPQATPPAQAPPADGRYGQVAIRVQPADAEVFIDGERWRKSDGAERLLVSLAPGTHRVEIRREGYDAFVTAIDVRRGETTPLNVSLARF